MNTVYNKRCGLFLGFHGCDESVRDNLLNHPQDNRISTNDYDWLGTGFYVWENNYERALDWSRHNKKIKNPSVIGVTYELANCLDLMDTDSINAIRESYIDFMQIVLSTGTEAPKNKDLSYDTYHDKLLRNLDCAVINHTTKRTDRLYIKDVKNTGYSLIEPYDTVRGCFTEGGKLFDTEIYERTHIQVCIRNLRSSSAGFHKAQRLKELHKGVLPAKRSGDLPAITLSNSYRGAIEEKNIKTIYIFIYSPN